MAAFSILKWHGSLQEGKSLSRYNVTSFYPKMAKLTSRGQVAGQTYGGFFYLKMAWLTSSWNFVFNWIFDKLVPGDRARLYFVEA